MTLTFKETKPCFCKTDIASCSLAYRKVLLFLNYVFVLTKKSKALLKRPAITSCQLLIFMDE